ncbi:response regulator transcription factor [Streptomyces sp. H27-C3]|uniref:response regulator transcription factor n=1 Tax=Streptomyces sp. H27-C3 TaxID=3046305 RepID=UPI0024B878E7|nr:response regulator transcription factor [Streptomyces sp. H27-C3]MDJ0466551.1 response regulator transcription factor [Streptomyces sp. H27-C3]
MPDESTYGHGPRSMATPVSTHVSQHTSSHTSEPCSDHTPAEGRVPPPAAAFPDPSSTPPTPPDLHAPPAVLRIVIVDDNPVVRAGLTVLLGGRDDIEVVAEATDGSQALAVAQRHNPDIVLLDVRMPGVDGLSVLPYLVQLAPVLMLTYSRESEVVREALRLGAGGYLVHGEFTADQLVSAVRDIRAGRAHFTTSVQDALLAHVRGGCQREEVRPLPGGLGAVYETGVPYRGTSRIPGYAPGADATAHPGVAHDSGPRVSNSLRQRENPSHVQSDVGQSSTERSRAQQAPAAPQSHNRRNHGLSSREVEVMDLIAAGMSNQQIAATCFISEKTVKNHINRIFAKLHSTSRSEAIAAWGGESWPT